MKAIWDHLRQWPELYIGVPLATLSIPAASGMVYLLTQHWPEENMGYLVDLASRVQVGALIIVAASLTRQGLGTWFTKEEQLAHPYIATLSSLSKAFYLCFFAWLFTR